MQNLAPMRLNSNNYGDDDDDCNRDNCPSDFGGTVVEIMFQQMPSRTKVINVNSN